MQQNARPLPASEWDPPRQQTLASRPAGQDSAELHCVDLEVVTAIALHEGPSRRARQPQLEGAAMAARPVGDPRAPIILESAYQRLQERAAKIQDAQLRCSFLENVPHHRDIVAAWGGAQGDA